jgi:hypothetical protein
MEVCLHFAVEFIHFGNILFDDRQFQYLGWPKCIHTSSFRACLVTDIQNKYENLMQHADFANNGA